MKGKRVSIKDIAVALNVTPSTVSRALNNGDRVGEKKRKEIIDLAKSWGYRPNLIARSMLHGRTFNIGLLLPSFTHHFFNLILTGIESITYPKGYQLLISTSNESRDKESKSCKTYIDARVDGVIAAVGNEEDDLSHFSEIIEEGIPLLLVDRVCEEVSTSCITTSDYDGSIQAVNYLIETGCKNILHIKGPDYISTSFNRWMGYQQSLKIHGIPYDNDLVLSGELSSLEIRLERFLAQHKIDGVFAFSDYHAYEAVKAIKKVGLEIPNDVSIIGYADEPIAKLTSPQLSTVYQPAFEMGKIAAENLLILIESGENGSPPQPLPTELKLRETTRSI